MSTRAILALENGMTFEGKAFGASNPSGGEVVFNTSMTGYQEILTDPSYAGQVVCLTYPEIGNYGISPEDIESARIHAAGLIVRHVCDFPSNWRGGSKSVSEYLAENGIAGIQGIDTRKLVRVLRSTGVMRGVILHGDISAEEAVGRAKAVPAMVGADLASKVTCKAAFDWEEKAHELQPQGRTFDGFKLVAIDFGVKFNTLRRLRNLGANLRVVPATTTAAEILAMKPDGVYLSNGPGDPEAVEYAIHTIRDLIGKVPVFGICLGHQLTALAMGAKTFKLKFGHRGANHPIKNTLTGCVEITSQNHGFAVSPDNFPDDIAEVTHINLNDNTIAGLKHKHYPVFSIQYHPEASPGPHDSYYLFEQFAENIRRWKSEKVSH